MILLYGWNPVVKILVLKEELAVVTLALYRSLSGEFGNRALIIFF